MQNILILGAGRSSTILIDYLYTKSLELNWKITVADFDYELVKAKCADKPEILVIELDIHDAEKRSKIISENDLIVSMLPARFHILAAVDACALNKHFINASYVKGDLEDVFIEGKSKSLIFMGELGLDPGLDHLSAMKLLNEIREEGLKIVSFRSFAGGLVAPENDDNPWGYKFSWNPRNVVLAGQGTAQFRANSRHYFTPYKSLFKDAYSIEVDGMGEYDWYPNRDSMSYISRYKLEKCETVIRGTLRKKGFCRAWDALIQLGLTDDKSELTQMQSLSYSEWLRGIMHLSKDEDLKAGLIHYLGIDDNDPIIEQIEYLDLLSNKKIELQSGTSAEILQQLLMKKWQLKEQEKDMIIMVHDIVSKNGDQMIQHTSTLVKEGKNSTETAMSSLVGLPLAIAAELIMTGVISECKELIPIEPKVYLPILKKLSELGIHFNETTRIL